MAFIIRSSKADCDCEATLRSAVLPYALDELSNGGDAATGPKQEAGVVGEQGVHDPVSSLAPALEEAVHRIEASRDAWLAHWEQAALGVAVAIAERVIRRQLDRAPDITLELVREALEMAAGRGDVQLRLHPHDHETLGPHAQRLARHMARLGQVDIVADATISKGGCRVDTRFGTIDQQLESQLRRIEQELG